jgi:DNA-binding GntR family transcriptional regulator
VLARAATRNVTQTSALRFHEAAQAMRKAVVIGSVVAFLEADKALDEAMAAAADNAFAARLAAPLQTHSRRFWFRYQAGTGLEPAAARHMALIKAMLDGDADGAAHEADRLMGLLRGHAVEAVTLPPRIIQF